MTQFAPAVRAGSWGDCHRIERGRGGGVLKVSSRTRQIYGEQSANKSVWKNSRYKRDYDYTTLRERS